MMLIDDKALYNDKCVTLEWPLTLARELIKELETGALTRFVCLSLLTSFLLHSVSVN